MEMIIGAIMGLFLGHGVHTTKSYCECLRDDFKGAYCESIKGTGEQKTCEVKEK